MNKSLKSKIYYALLGIIISGIFYIAHDIYYFRSQCITLAKHSYEKLDNVEVKLYEFYGDDQFFPLWEGKMDKNLIRLPCPPFGDKTSFYIEVYYPETNKTFKRYYGYLSDKTRRNWYFFIGKDEVIYSFGYLVDGYRKTKFYTFYIYMVNLLSIPFTHLSLFPVSH